MALAGACSSGGSLSEWTVAHIRFRPASVSQNARTASWTAEVGRVALWSSATDVRVEVKESAIDAAMR